MNKLRFTIKLYAIAICMFAFASLVSAQTTRTWVSGVGDDMDSCSRTTPCKTFAGAFTKTLEGGEINVLDPGGYGGLTITKAITIDGGTSSGSASIIASSSNAIYINIDTSIVNHPDDAVVVLRNLSFNGLSQTSGSPGNTGVQYAEAAQVHIENCQFQNFGSTGIHANLGSLSGQLTVQDCVFDNVNTVINATTNAPSFVVIQYERNRAVGSANGLNANPNTFATIRDSYFGSLTGINGGVRAAAGAQVNVVNSTFVNNNIGVNVAGGTIRLSNNQFFNNTTAISGTAESANNNKFSGNTADGNTTNVITVQ